MRIPPPEWRVNAYNSTNSAIFTPHDFSSCGASSYQPTAYKTTSRYSGQIFEVGATSVPCMSPISMTRPRRAGALGEEGEDGDGEEGEDGYVDEGKGDHLDNPYPVGDISWGMVLCFAGIYVVLKRRQTVK